MIKSINLDNSLVLLLFLAGVALFSLAIFWGITAVTAFLFPVFWFLAIASIFCFVFMILPLSIFPILRPRLFLASQIFAGICGVSVWMYSFLIIVKHVGWLTMLLAFFFHIVPPIAAFMLLLTGQLREFAGIVGGLAFAYAMRYYGQRLVGVYEEKTVSRWRYHRRDR